jgi:hypothetical protein
MLRKVVSKEAEVSTCIKDSVRRGGILIATNFYLPRSGMYMLVILGLKESLRLPGRNVQCEPTLVVRVHY